MVLKDMGDERRRYIGCRKGTSRFTVPVSSDNRKLAT